MNNFFKAVNDEQGGKYSISLKRDLTAGEIADQFNITKPSILIIWIYFDRQTWW